ncbi:MAG: hypothetical protein HYW48_09400 [Deltaproteobacteria bacterium]|nr:hypothetical protein [Deltaproteobacteria bacterium]
MEETAQLVPPKNPLGEATLHSPPQPPLSLFAPSGLRITLAIRINNQVTVQETARHESTANRHSA